MSQIHPEGLRLPYVAVTLTPAEIVMAAAVGAARYAESIQFRRRDVHGFDPSQSSGLAIHVEGACGELAVAKLRGRYWGGTVGSFKAADIGTNVQVRTRSRHDYDLIVRSDDADDDIFVHVTGVAPTYHVHGWIRGADAKRPEYVQSHGGRAEAWFVPASALKPIGG